MDSSDVETAYEINTFYVAFEQAASKLRLLPSSKVDALIREGAKPWLKEGLPPKDDPSWTQQFMQKCGGICGQVPQSPEDCVTVQMAALAALQVIQNHKVLGRPSEVISAICLQARSLLNEKLNGTPILAPDPSSRRTRRVPYVKLLNQTIQYYDIRERVIRRWTMTGFGTGRDLTPWYSGVWVEGGKESSEIRIEEEELEGMLAMKV